MSSGADTEPTPKSQPLPPIPDNRAFAKPPLNPVFVKQETAASPAPADLLLPDAVPIHRNAGYQSMPPVGSAPSSRLSTREIPFPDEAEVEAALRSIETTEMNDLEGSGDTSDKEEFAQQSRKRALDVEVTEGTKRKVSLPPGFVYTKLT